MMAHQQSPLETRAVMELRQCFHYEVLLTGWFKLDGLRLLRGWCWDVPDLLSWGCWGDDEMLRLRRCFALEVDDFLGSGR